MSLRSLDHKDVSLRCREGVDVICSVNQGDLSILFACVLIDVRLVSLLKKQTCTRLQAQVHPAERTAIMGVFGKSGLHNSSRARGFR